jgi:hypothetical protein
LESSSRISTAQVLEPDFLDFYLQAGWLRVALFVESGEIWCRVLPSLGSFFDKLHSLDFFGSAHVVPDESIHDFNIFGLVLKFLFAFKDPLNFLRKTVSLPWTALQDHDFDNVLAGEAFGFQNGDELN